MKPYKKKTKFLANPTKNINFLKIFFCLIKFKIKIKSAVCIFIKKQVSFLNRSYPWKSESLTCMCHSINNSSIILNKTIIKYQILKYIILAWFTIVNAFGLSYDRWLVSKRESLFNFFDDGCKRSQCICKHVTQW